MRSVLRVTLGVFVTTAMIALGATVSQAQGPGPGPVFPPGFPFPGGFQIPGSFDPQPSWDQTAVPRFVVLTNFGSAAVQDRNTGLVWERTPSTTSFVWTAALSHCYKRGVTATTLGFRLPTIEELTSLFQQAPGSPQIQLILPPGNPFVVPVGGFWSASTSAADVRQAWVVSQLSGVGVDTFDKTSPFFFALCVRTGHGHDAR
jgi:hypothetical protein